MSDLTTLTDTEARDLLAAVYADVQRRDAVAQAPAQAEALATAYAAAIGRKDGDPWQAPTGAHDVYLMGAVVNTAEGYRRSTHAANSWDPLDPHGARWWEPVWTDGDDWTTTPPEGAPIEPWDPARSYSNPPGAVVTHNGQVWDLTHTNADPGWEPGGAGMHSVWKART